MSLRVWDCTDFTDDPSQPLEKGLADSMILKHLNKKKYIKVSYTYIATDESI